MELESQQNTTENLVYFFQAAEYFWDTALEAHRCRKFGLADQNFLEALKKYNVCSNLDPSNHYYFHQMGMCLYSLSYFPDAEAKNKSLLIAHDAFKCAIDLHKHAHPKPDVDQKCVRAMYIRDLADCLIEQKRFRAADLILAEALAIDPTPLSLAFSGVLKATYLGQKETGKILFDEAFNAAARGKNDELTADIYAYILKLGRESGLIPLLSLVRQL